MSTRTDAATPEVAAPRADEGVRASEAPRRPLTALHGDAAQEAREIGARLLASYDRGQRMEHGGSCGPDRITREEHRTRGVEFEVHDAAAIASQRAWHTYWRACADPRGHYRTNDPEKLAAAPPSPSYGFEFVAHGTWEQLRTWLSEPEQTSMFDLLGGTA